MDDDQKKQQTINVLKTLLFNIQLCHNSAESLDQDHDVSNIMRRLAQASTLVEKELEALNG